MWAGAELCLGRCAVEHEGRRGRRRGWRGRGGGGGRHASRKDLGKDPGKDQGKEALVAAASGNECPAGSNAPGALGGWAAGMPG
jgi:hypothetical protein